MLSKIVNMSKVLVIILAGGDGTRIEPLSRPRAKPAVPIGPTNRLIDVALSNSLNSTIGHMVIAVQRRAWSLTRHLDGYAAGIAPMLGQYIHVLTPPKDEEQFFLSDANSLTQIERAWANEDFDYVIVVMADQVVKVDYRQMIHALLESQADAVFATLDVPVDQATGRLGVFETDSSGRVTSFEEKPEKPKTLPGDATKCRANLAMYAFRRPIFDAMMEQIRGCAPELTLCQSAVPWLVSERNILAYDLATNHIEGMTPRERAFFEDVGGLDAWFATSMAICDIDPAFNFYSEEWPIYTAPRWPMSAAKIDRARLTEALLLGWNVILQDAVSVRHSVLGSGSVVGVGSLLSNVVLLDDVKIGQGCVLDRVVFDKGIHVPDNTRLVPASLPVDAITFEALIDLIRRSETVPNAPVLSTGGTLFYPKGYRFD